MAWEQPEFWHCGASERSPVYLDSSAFALLTIFFLYIYFYFLEDRPAICVYVQYKITVRVYFILFFPPRFVFNLFQKKSSLCLPAAWYPYTFTLE